MPEAVQSCSCFLPVSCSPLPPLSIFLLFYSSLSSFAFLPPFFPLLFLSYFLYLYVPLSFFLSLPSFCFFPLMYVLWTQRGHILVTIFVFRYICSPKFSFSFSVFQPCLPSPHTQITETFPLPITSSVPLFFTLC